MQNKLNHTYPVDINNPSTIPNLHTIKMQIHGNVLKLSSDRFKNSISYNLSDNEDTNEAMAIALQKLSRMGFNIIAKSFIIEKGIEKAIILTDTFKRLDVLYRFSFEGRKNGSEGITYKISQFYYAANPEEALFMLYSEYEHILYLVVNENNKILDSTQFWGAKQEITRIRKSK